MKNYKEKLCFTMKKARRRRKILVMKKIAFFSAAGENFTAFVKKRGPIFQILKSCLIVVDKVVLVHFEPHLYQSNFKSQGGGHGPVGPPLATALLAFAWLDKRS